VPRARGEDVRSAFATGASRRRGLLHRGLAQALIALARRLVDVVWALLRDQRAFAHAQAPAA
jgi:hypothetical protein